MQEYSYTSEMGPCKWLRKRLNCSNSNRMKKYLFTIGLFFLMISSLKSQTATQSEFLFNNPPFYNYPTIDVFRMNQPNIVGCGGTFMNSSNSFGLITKVDTSGNLIWLKS